MMSPDFVRSFAPHLSITSPDSGGGMTGPDQPYDSTGTPLPYMQTEDQPRQYFGVAAPIGGMSPEQPADATGTPLPWMQNQGGPRQYFGTPGPDGLRGTTPTAVATPDPGALRGMSTPPDNTSPPQNMLQNGIRNGSRARIPIPPMGQGAIEDHIMEGIRTGNIDPSTPNSAGQRAMQQGPTVADMANMDLGQLLSRFNINLPRPIQGLRGTTDEKTVDRPITLGNRPGTVTQAGQRMGRAQEVADFLRANGIRVTSVIRTGNARPNGHPAGNSIDVDYRDRQRAMALIRQHYPDLASESFDIKNGQNFGNGVVAHGDHGHIDLGTAAARPARPQ